MASPKGKTAKAHKSGKDKTMKKITKKAIKEAHNYTIAIDYCIDTRSHKAGNLRAWHNTHWNMVALNADNLLDAMSEAEAYFNEDTYMMHLLEKTGNLLNADEYPTIEYKAVLASRHKGAWHRHDQHHGESEDFTFGWDTDWNEYNLD